MLPIDKVKINLEIANSISLSLIAKSQSSLLPIQKWEAKYIAIIEAILTTTFNTI